MAGGNEMLLMFFFLQRQIVFSFLFSLIFLLFFYFSSSFSSDTLWFKMNQFMTQNPNFCFYHIKVLMILGWFSLVFLHFLTLSLLFNPLNKYSQLKPPSFSFSFSIFSLSLIQVFLYLSQLSLSLHVSLFIGRRKSQNLSMWNNLVC